MHLLFILLPAKLLALFVGLRYFRRLPTPYILLLCQVFFALVSESVGYYLGTVQHQNNIWVFYYYLLIDCWLMGMSGRYFLADSIFKKSLPVILTILSGLWLADLFGTGLHTFSNKFFIGYGIFLVVVYIATLTNRVLIGNEIFRNPVFWICLSTILYYGCIIPYMGLLNYLIKNAPNTADKLYDIILLLNFIRYPLVAFAFYLFGRQQLAEQRAV